ncbi:MAG: tRNA uridine-5-carboxymethylaminomethyl(34) synthesis GTPase MnmE [Rhodobacteraceae bacterium]|nr:tRNA uridine-5-carboxymethylaminomethyl(34) synthesis GTPase MnmE [Paracoccaceae bacterium]
MDTIYALASAQGKSGVAVIRISGPRAHNAVRALAGDLPEVRRTSLRNLRDGDGGLIDSGLVVVFSEGASFTGEAAAELHVHGSRATIAAVLRALSMRPGLRPAEPGEFSRRAFENGRLDLTEVEGLADLIDAETEAQRRQALRVLSGALRERTENWRERMIQAMSLLEASIDFAEEDVPEDVLPEVRSLLLALRSDLHAELAGSAAAERIRDGFEVAIIGPPNIGKSTLLNRLAGRDAAITSEIAGTTRDVIEVRMDLGGLPVTILDTAGLRETGDVVEALGIERALQRARMADIRVVLSDGTRLPGVEIGPEDIVVRAKGDLHEGSGAAVSGLTGAGVTELLARLADTLSSRVANAGLAVQERHRLAIGVAVAALNSALARLNDEAEHPEIPAEDLRRAVYALDALVGRVDVEQVLDRIFSSFCIGK